MKYRYLILGTNTIKRIEQSEHEWKIKTSDQYQGKIGIIDVTNQLGQNGDFASKRLNLKNGVSTIWNRPNIICVGSVINSMCGGVRGKQNDKIMGSFIGKNDILTITLNYGKNTVAFKSNVTGKDETPTINKNANVMRLILIFYGRDSWVEMLD